MTFISAGAYVFSSYTFIRFDYPFVLLYICSLGFLSSAAFLFLRQVLGWKLGLGEECIGALSGLPHGLEAHFIWTSFGPGLD